jgi:hypothetical protein
MMAEEIELTKGNLSLVSASKSKLSLASNEYDKQHGKLKTSKSLLRIIRWHEKKEDYLLYTGLTFFCSCVLYIVVRRSMLFIPALPTFSWLWPSNNQMSPEHVPEVASYSRVPDSHSTGEL